ncbi:MAG TPA: tetratricopeptide repeat protein [Actinophytocola sp.]|jgi:Tfp pilus assembly protein PilF|uniref:tetratricopeptide repeat protein n=1 Tax=Actinophytocola sp. TaxID=1872138 RepID=UPI002F93BDE7
MADPGGSIDSVLLQAARLTAEGRPESAIAVLRPALARYPDHSAAWCRLSAAQLDAGAPADSLESAKRAMTLGERSWGHRLASLALLELHRYPEAVVSAREAVRRDAADWRGHVTLAEALVHETPAEAMRVARTAVALAPEEARAHEVLGDAAVAVHDWLEADRAYRAALSLDPDNGDVLAKVARLARRPPERPAEQRRSARAPVTPRFGRAERVEAYLAVRRAALWQAAGTLVLLLAGRPGPNGLLAWVGLGIALFVAALVVRGWLGLPARARRALSTGEPRVVVGAVLLGVSVLLLLVWTVLAALGSGPWLVLLLALVLATVAVANTSLGMWRVFSDDG